MKLVSKSEYVWSITYQVLYKKKKKKIVLVSSGGHMFFKLLLEKCANLPCVITVTVTAAYIAQINQRLLTCVILQTYCIG